MSAFTFLSGLGRTISEARERARVTRALDGMSDRSLRDIGISRAEIDIVAAGGVRRTTR